MRTVSRVTGSEHPDPLAELQRAGAARLGHAGRRRLLDHLQGTRTILAQWGQRADLCNAGLFHSCYSTDSYRHALFQLADRDSVRSLIGSVAEDLVYRFCTIDRAQFLR